MRIAACLLSLTLLPVGEHPRWNDTVAELRLDPAGGSPHDPGRIDVIPVV